MWFTLYILHIVDILVFWCVVFLCFNLFFPSPEKLHFFCKKCIFSHSFWPRWLKQTLFYREFNYLHSIVLSFSTFHLFPVKTTQNKQTITWKRKICKKTWKHKICKKNNIFPYTLFFLNFKNGKLCALHLVFVNEIKSSILFYLWNCRRRCIFCRAPINRIFSMQIVFFTFYRKNLETNYVWGLMIHISCLEQFYLRWILNFFFTRQSASTLFTKHSPTKTKLLPGEWKWQVPISMAIENV